MHPDASCIYVPGWSGTYIYAAKMLKKNAAKNIYVFLHHEKIYWKYIYADIQRHTTLHWHVNLDTLSSLLLHEIFEYF